LLTRPSGSRREENGWLFCSSWRPRTVFRRAADAHERRPELAFGGHDPPRPQVAAVVGIRDDDADEPPVLIVEHLAK
jgi:hypothetical protein